MYLGKWRPPQAKDKLVTLSDKTMSINIDIYITMFTICKELSNFLHIQWCFEWRGVKFMILESAF